MGFHTGDVRIEVFQPKGPLIGIEALGAASEPGSLKLFDDALNQCRSGVAFGLNQKVKNLALIVDDAPQPMSFATDHGGRFVKMPIVAGRRSRSSQVAGHWSTNFQEPAPASFVGNIETAFRE